MYVLLLFIVFVGGGYLIGKLLGYLFSGSSKNLDDVDNKTIIHNHITNIENHLHVTDDDLKNLLN